MSTKQLIICLVIIVLIGLLSANWNKVKAAVPAGIKGVLGGATTTTGATKTATGKGGGKTTSTGTSSGNSNPDRQLSNGSTGSDVKDLQVAMNTCYGGSGSPLVTDGIFGSLTLARLKEMTGKTSISYNEFMGLVADGTLDSGN